MPIGKGSKHHPKANNARRTCGFKRALLLSAIERKSLQNRISFPSYVATIVSVDTLSASSHGPTWAASTSIFKPVSSSL
jgi:hypothetical protein